MRIGAIWDRRIPNSLYRVVIPMRALATNGIAVLWDGLSANAFDVDCLSRCDVVLIHRFTDVHVRRLAQRLRRGGVAIWWDNDDAVDAMPPSEISNAQKRRRMAHVGAEVAQMLSLADLVSAPCRALADRFERGGATRVHVIENH